MDLIFRTIDNGNLEKEFLRISPMERIPRIGDTICFKSKSEKFQVTDVIMEWDDIQFQGGLETVIVKLLTFPAVV